MSRATLLHDRVVAFFNRITSESILNRLLWGRINPQSLTRCGDPGEGLVAPQPRRRTAKGRGRKMPSKDAPRRLRTESLEIRQLLSGGPTITFGSGSGLNGAAVSVPILIANPDAPRRSTCN